MKPFSEACERNQDPILDVLRQWFASPGTVLEIGSGTGQHAVHFARHLPHLHWVCTDREENHSGIRAWLDEAQLPNLSGPLELDVTQASWPVDAADYVFSANTAHIMGWPEVEALFAGAGKVLSAGGVLCLYGPFNSSGKFTSDSNRAFDAMLRRRNPVMGIRDDRALVALGQVNELTLQADHAMPANNRILVWKKAPL